MNPANPYSSPTDSPEPKPLTSDHQFVHVEFHQSVDDIIGVVKEVNDYLRLRKDSALAGHVIYMVLVLSMCLLSYSKSHSLWSTFVVGSIITGLIILINLVLKPLLLMLQYRNLKKKSANDACNISMSISATEIQAERGPIKSIIQAEGIQDVYIGEKYLLLLVTGISCIGIPLCALSPEETQKIVALLK